MARGNYPVEGIGPDGRRRGHGGTQGGGPHVSLTDLETGSHPTRNLLPPSPSKPSLLCRNVSVSITDAVPPVSGPCGPWSSWTSSVLDLLVPVDCGIKA